VRTDPSAEPGAKTEGWAAAKLVPPIFPIPSGLARCDKSLAAKPRASGRQTAFNSGKRSPGQGYLRKAGSPFQA